jgi:hypothetical protein
MVKHLALLCSKITGEVKNIFLQELRERNALKVDLTSDPDPINDNDQPKGKKQKVSLVQTKITSKFEPATEIDSAKVRSYQTHSLSILLSVYVHPINFQIRLHLLVLG